MVDGMGVGDGVIASSSYVVQVGNEDTKVWTDVATVEVPARTKRRRVIELGFAQSKIMPKVGEDLRVRVLDAESAEVIPVGAEEQEPKLRIG